VLRRALAILLVALVLASVPAYAAEGMFRHRVAVGPVNVQADMNAHAKSPRGPIAVTATAAVNVSPRAQARIMEMLEKQFGPKKLEEWKREGIRPEDIARRVAERRAYALSGRMYGNAAIDARITKDYMRVVRALRQTATIFAQKRQRWAHYHELYVRGEIDENTYFNVTKDMVLSAIDATIARLEVVNNTDFDGNSLAISQAVSRLQKIRSDVESAQDLEQLRQIYKNEVLPAIRKYHDRVFGKVYVLATIRATRSIVVRLDAATARLTRYVELAKKRGVYDEEMDNRVNAIFANIAAVNAELNALQSEVQNKDISSPREYLEKIRSIKEEVVKIYREIGDLFRDYNRKFAIHAREQAHERHKTQGSIAAEQSADVNAGAGAVGVEQNTEVNTAITVETDESTGTGMTVGGEVNVSIGDQNASVGASGSVEVMP